jgi:hypothetical protein
MASPSTSLSTLRPDLASSLEEFDLQADRAGFIGLRVAPVIEVAKPSGNFGKVPIEQLLQTRDTKRAPGSGYSRGKFTFTSASFATAEHGAEEAVDDREAKIYNNYLNAELIATARARDAVLRNFEIRMAALIFNSSTWTGETLTTAVGTAWTSHDDATPVDDVEAAVLRVWGNSGLWPNALIMNRVVYRHLRQCAQVIDRITSGGAGQAAKAGDITPALLAQVFDVEEIIIAGSAKNTANIAATASLSSIWGNGYCMVGRVCRSADPREPGLARTFHYGEDGSSIGSTLESYRDETVRGDVIRARMETDELVMYTEAGHLLTSVAA